MNKIIYFGCIGALFSAITSSCDKDEEDTNNNSSTTQKRVVNCILSDDNGYYYEETYEYDNTGRLVKIKYEDEDPLNFKYENDKITLFEGDNIFSTITLNSQGFISNLTDAGNDSNYNCNFWYDKQGYLTKSNKGKETITYEWENGNLKKVTEIEGEGEFITFILSYTDESITSPIENKANIQLNSIYYDGLDNLIDNLPLGSIAGKSLKNFPILIERSCSYDSQFSGISRFTWTLDNEGYPICANETFTSSNTKEVTNYSAKFTWK